MFNRIPKRGGKTMALLEAAQRLLEARYDQMVTRQEWDDLSDAVVEAGGSLPPEHDDEDDEKN
jgi:hypothetical protein